MRDHIHHQFLIEMLFAAEVIVENRLGYPCGITNFSYGTRRIPLLGEEFFCRFQNGESRAFHGENYYTDR
jgi:hypothetical protein